MRSIIDPPPRSAYARFAPDFGQRFLLTIELSDGEPAEGASIPAFQRLCEEEGAVPLYLVGAEAMASQEVHAALRAPLAARRAELGVLYPAGNDPTRLERLVEQVEQRFGAAPVIGRAADRPSPPPATLIECGLAIDCSARPKHDASATGGADFRRHPLMPYWVDEERMLLELPQTSVSWGLLRRQGDWLYPLLDRAPGWRKLAAGLALLERIALTPEEADLDQAIRAVDIALDDGLPVLVFTGRLPPLAAFAPFADWWERILAYLSLRRVPNASVAALMQAVNR